MSSERRRKVTPTPKISVSWGELIDKITILEIKERRITSEQAIANVRGELAALMHVCRDVLLQRDDLVSLKNALLSVNETLWDIEDEIRAKEAAKSFDVQFVELARSVYANNDKRGRLKRKINELLQSEFTEEKQYTVY